METQRQLKNAVKSIYLAGAIGSLDWRQTEVQGLRNNSWRWRDRVQFPVLKRSIFGRFDYLGPYFPFVKGGLEHISFPGGHLRAYSPCMVSDEEYREFCREAIDRADVVAFHFGFEDSDLCYQHDAHWDNWETASQFAYAVSLGKPLLCINHPPFSREFVTDLILGNREHRRLVPRLSLGRQLGLSNAEINREAGHGSVYFIEDTGNKHIKIGWAKSPESRLQTFQTASSMNLKLLGTLPGNRTLEHKLHLQFSDYQVDREWFFGVQAIRDYIDANLVNASPSRSRVQSEG